MNNDDACISPLPGHSLSSPSPHPPHGGAGPPGSGPGPIVGLAGHSQCVRADFTSTGADFSAARRCTRAGLARDPWARDGRRTPASARCAPLGPVESKPETGRDRKLLGSAWGASSIISRG